MPAIYIDGGYPESGIYILPEIILLKALLPYLPVVPSAV